MAGFLQIVGNFFFLALFILAGLSFIIVGQATNDAAQPITENVLVNDSLDNLEGALDDLEDSSNSQFDNYNSEVPTPGFGSIVLFGIVAVGKTFSTIIITIFTVVITLPLVIFGIPVSIASTIYAWLIISLIAGTWILYKLGG